MNGKRSKYEYLGLGNYLFLTFMRIWARIGAHFFFYRLRVTGTEKIPLDRPVIFCVNHQSAFLDPVLIGITCKRKPWYITRAGVFTNEIVKYLLRSLHMLPIFRPRDKVDIKSANEDTFEYCKEVLAGRGSVVIFVEGNHDMRKRLRAPLKKGFARMALASPTAPDQEVMIVPVGLTYEDPVHPRSEVFIQYGTPFSVSDYIPAFEVNEAEAQTSLTRELEGRLRPLMLDISNPEKYDELERQWQKGRQPAANLQKRFDDDQRIIEGLLKDETVKKITKRRFSIGDWILKVLSIPIILLGYLLNIPLILLTKTMVGRVVRDPHFDQSVLFVCGLAGVPLFGLFQFVLLNWWTGQCWPSLITAVITPILGLLAYDCVHRLWNPRRYVPSRELMQMRS